MNNTGDFIEVYEDVFSNEFCDNLVKYFEWQSQNAMTWRRDAEGASPLNKSDEAITVNPNRPIDLEFTADNLDGYLKEFHEKFWNICYRDYISKNPIICELDRHTIFTYKIQKTKPSEGYHLWHCEIGSTGTSRRLLTYTVYLNDVEEGGETEFLNQRRRVKAKKGSVVIFPAGFTHVHRGNTPLSNDKYIMTGWVEFT